tara:strand:+ start:108 stop:284 length:177 start_codon:yes stop_codon:yes gene_type:complete
MEYHISYEDLDKHWIVTCTDGSYVKVIMRFPSRDQAESFVENRINLIGDGENNFENNA